jgi:hypothetical protein
MSGGVGRRHVAYLAGLSLVREGTAVDGDARDVMLAKLRVELDGAVGEEEGGLLPVGREHLELHHLQTVESSRRRRRTAMQSAARRESINRANAAAKKGTARTVVQSRRPGGAPRTQSGVRT